MMSYAIGGRLRSSARGLVVGVFVASLSSCVSQSGPLGGTPRVTAPPPTAIASVTGLPSPMTRTAETRSAAGTRSALVGARWRPLPQAPIRSREPEVSVWVGTRLLVWGGVVTGTAGPALVDGALYDPARHTWRLLAPSPLTARTNTASVWTGSRLLVWGGYGADGSRRDDGATYDPRDDTWRMLPPSPLLARAGATAVAVGDNVLIVAAQGESTNAAASVYDMSRDAWRRTSAPPAFGATYAWVAGGAPLDGHALVLMHTQLVTNTSGGQRGYDDEPHALIYDFHSDTWTVLVTTGQPRTVGKPLMTGTGVLVPPAAWFCGAHSCAPPSNDTGALLLAGGREWHEVPAVPGETVGGQSVWTGSSLVRVSQVPRANRPVLRADGWTPEDGWTSLAEPPANLATASIGENGIEVGVLLPDGPVFWAGTSDGPLTGYELTSRP